MRRIVCLGAAVLILAACESEKRGSTFDLPKSNPHVLSVEAQLGPLIEKSQRGSRGVGECTVRLLGEKDDTTWAWASCRWLPEGGSGGPFRIKGDTVTGTKDGSEYDDSVRQLFPYDLAEAILYDAERLKPLTEPTG